MKKSDMINKIVSKIEEIQFKKFYTYFDNSNAEELLDALEELGMLPPCSYCNNPPSCYCTKSGYVHNYEWEPENDK